MGLWTTYKKRRQASAVKLRILDLEPIVAPEGILRGRLALESPTPALVSLMFSLVCEDHTHDANESSSGAEVLARVRPVAPVPLRAQIPTVVEFQMPYNLSAVCPLTWRLTQAMAASEIDGASATYYLEARCEPPAGGEEAHDRALLLVAPG